jgi:hypothetical protein
MHKKARFWRLALLLLSGLLVGGHANAVPVWAESGDAGQLPATAQTPIGVGALTTITGAIISLVDADLFVIHISTPALFSASTVGTPGTVVDTQLFLFDLSGNPIAANDDDGAVLRRSRLAAGNALYASLAPGDYLLGISAWDTDPLSAGGAIFPNDATSNNTVVGPTGPGGGSALSAWTVPGQELGSYTIKLTGAAYVPEPNTLVLFALGLAGLGVGRRKQA